MRLNQIAQLFIQNCTWQNLAGNLIDCFFNSPREQTMATRDSSGQSQGASKFRQQSQIFSRFAGFGIDGLGVGLQVFV